MALICTAYHQRLYGQPLVTARRAAGRHARLRGARRAVGHLGRAGRIQLAGCLRRGRALAHDFRPGPRLLTAATWKYIGDSVWEPFAPPAWRTRRLPPAVFTRSSVVISPVSTRSLRGPRRERMAKLHTDKGYDHDRLRRWLCRRGFRHRIARKGIDSSQRLGQHRWVVERTVSDNAEFPQSAGVPYPVLRDIRVARHL